ncbi:hypothetical protein OSB04_026707 [Centaurea solstitialis]|uniref:Caffeoyl-CoA O-methyltransferase n=1 Tax=Centaurea solstitialis TaxID=347529 RepID=A0AA38W9J1_9ASTR|nr:hypothetical protein OSB04_026707 [Centaurea solstitialis]
MTGSVIHGGWVFPQLSSFVPGRLCTRYAAIATANARRSFGRRKSYLFTTNCVNNVAAVTVASDHNYGNKQVISITPRVYDYLLSNVREPSVGSSWFFPTGLYDTLNTSKERDSSALQVLRELREETATMHGSQMQVSPDQAQLLAMLVQILGAKRCIEVGVYTGYSSLAVALVLPDSGILVACERDKNSLEVAKKYYDRAGVSHKVDVRHGLAADTLNSMIENGEGCSYDFAFVDAEKRMYQDYFELLLKLVRAGGLIVIDNVLWHGKVADPLVNDKKTESIRSFNRALMEDERVSISMVCLLAKRT